MARTGILTGGSDSAQTTSEDLNGLATDLISADGVKGAVGNTSGVAPMTGGLAVNAQGSPNTTSAVSAGIAYVTATPTSQGSQRLRVNIDAQNVTHASNTSGSTRYDWIYVAVSASLAANPASDMSTTGTIVVSRSTSNVSDNGTPPTYGYCIAVVTLANNFTTVTNGSIADKRSQVGMTASALTPGTTYLGSATHTSANFTTTSTGSVQVTDLSVAVVVPAAAKKLKLTVNCSMGCSAAGQTALTVWDGAVSSGTQVGITYNGAGTSTESATIIVVVPVTGGTSKTYNVGFATAATTTGTIYASTAGPATLLVEALY